MPNRIIKESICTSEEINQLTAFQETMFYRLIVNCDDYGRMDARVKILASKLFPLRRDIRESQIEDALRALTSAELVITYVVDGKPFLQMKTWDKHQTIRAKYPKYPGPERGAATHAEICLHEQADESICKQVQADVSICCRNPIQSETESESKTKTERARLDAAFERFWAAYPRKTDKQDAKKAFFRLKPDEGLMQIMLAAIEKQKKSAQWAEEGGRFVPHASTWLNGCRWEDELPKAVPKWANDAFHSYTQREYTEEELLAVNGDDLLDEARKYRDREGHDADSV